MATIANIKKLNSESRVSRIKALAEKPSVGLKDRFQKPQDDTFLRELVARYFEPMEKMILELVEQILSEKLQEFEKLILARAKPGQKGNKPLAGVDFILPKDGKDADEKKIVSTILSLLPPPQRIDEKKLKNEITKELALKIPKEKSVDELKKVLSFDAEEITGLATFVNKRIPPNMGGGGGGDTMDYRNISGDLDGSTKTFTLTRTREVILVVSSSFPHVHLPTTDWTFDTATSQITFTDEIDAATVLAEGQTIIALIKES